MSLRLDVTRTQTARRRIAVDVSGVGVLENYRIDVVRGLVRHAAQHADWELFYNLGDFSLVHRFDRFEDLARMGVQGIVFSYWEPEKVRAIRRLGIPMVSLSNLDPEVSRRVPLVVCDDVEVGRQAARHLLERGFENFAAYCDAEGRRWEAGRLRGFREVLRAAGFEASRMRHQSFADPPRAASNLAAWLRRLPRPVAIFAGTDLRAFHVLEACRAEGIAVPGDVAIVGVDNNPFICESQHHSISSVALDGERVGMEAARLLDDLIDGRRPSPGRVLVRPLGVVTRGSSDIAGAGDAAVARAMLFVREHYGEDLGLDDIAEAAEVSRSTLERRVRARLGMTLGEVLRRRRLEMAKAMLRRRTGTLEAIARACGFRRATYLCNVFREVEGITPRAWQRLAGG